MFVADIVRIGERKAIYQIELLPEEQLFITISGETRAAGSLWEWGVIWVDLAEVKRVVSVVFSLKNALWKCNSEPRENSFVVLCHANTCCDKLWSRWFLGHHPPVDDSSCFVYEYFCTDFFSSSESFV